MRRFKWEAARPSGAESSKRLFALFFLGEGHT
nr:MAG TPA: hypothetical protein [Caudoviricetes sp.]